MHSVVVAAGILIESGRVLLTQRKAGAHLAGLWEFPGGKVEDGEDPRDALSRELREELGIDGRAGAIVEVTFHKYDDATRAILLLFYEFTRAATSPEPSALDVAAFRWADASELDPGQFPAADVPVLAKVGAMLSR